MNLQYHPQKKLEQSCCKFNCFKVYIFIHIRGQLSTDQKFHFNFADHSTWKNIDTSHIKLETTSLFDRKCKSVKLPLIINSKTIKLIPSFDNIICHTIFSTLFLHSLSDWAFSINDWRLVYARDAAVNKFGGGNSSFIHCQHDRWARVALNSIAIVYYVASLKNY